MHAVITFAVVLTALLTVAWPARAQEFPAKPIELILAYGGGGSHDLTARAVASVAQQYLGQPLLVVLKPGGGGAVGSQQVIRAKPDGYTLLFGGSGPNTTFALVQKAPIGPDQFTPVARIRGLIKDLGDDVYFQAFERTWRDEWEQHARIVAGAR